jgi:HK97 family phage prohead protease
MLAQTELTIRSITLAPSTYKPTTGTVEAVLSTGAGVPRRDSRGPFMEHLATGPDAVSLHTDRLPVLDTHRQRSVADVMGYVSGVRSEGGKIIATLTITSPSARALIESGAVTGVSIGYRGTEWAESDGGKVRTATKWRLMEVSIVAVPADPGATLRSQSVEPTTTTTEPPLPPPPPAIESRAAVNAAIRTLGATLSLGTPWADAQIDAGTDLPAARLAALAEIERRSAAGIISVRQTAPSGDDPEVTRMGDALANRMNAALPLPEAAAQYRGMALSDMARVMVAARGERGVAYMSKETLLTRAVTTGDLPNLLVYTGNRTLLSAYQAAQSALKLLARQSTVVDFRKKTEIRLGEMSTLSLVPETGEVTTGGVAEAAESYYLATYAKIFSLTRQAMINDDLGAFGDITGAMGRAAAETEAQLLVQLLLQNGGYGPTMTDGTALFNVLHDNLAGTASAIGLAGLSAGRQALRTQTGVDGKTPINAAAKYILTSPVKETEAEQALTALYAAIQINANVFAGRLEVLVDPRLSGLQWYLFADPAILPCIEYAYLSGAPGPQMISRPGWDVLGMEFRVHLDFGCGTIDWRGAYLNTGA